MSLLDLGFSLAKPFLHGKDAEEAHLATLRLLTTHATIAGAARLIRRWRNSCSASTFPIRWAWPRVLTRMPKCPMPCCGWDLDLWKSAH